MNRTYKIQHHTNTNKQKKIIETLTAYRKTAKAIAPQQWQLFYTGGRFRKNLDIKHIPSSLSGRYKQTCQYQVVAVLESYISNRQRDFVDVVSRSSIEEPTRHKLFTVNALKVWYKIAPCSLISSRMELDAGSIRLARKIFKHVLSRHKKPSFGAINMALDDKVALISKKTPGKAVAYDYWIRLSTIESGRPVYLPISTNAFFKGIPGQMKKFCQINLQDNNKLTVSFVKDVPRKTNDYIPETPKIALDLGLLILFATDKGDLLGRKFFEQLKKYDALISELAANRQRQNLKVRTTRYDRLAHDIRNT